MTASGRRPPLAGLEADLDFERASEATVTLHVPADAGLPRDPRQLRMAVYLGVYDLLAERAVEDAGEVGAGTAALERALRLVEASDGPLRFALFERRSRAEAQELVARMRGKEVAMTEGWMLPRLEQDIAAYRERVAALRRALDAAGGRAS